MWRQYKIEHESYWEFLQILTLFHISTSFSNSSDGHDGGTFPWDPDMQLHYDPMFDSLYIVGSCLFCLYLFSHRDFAIPLFHPAFNPSVPYFTISLHVAHPAPPPPPAAPTATPPASPPQVLPNISLSFESDPSKAIDSPSSSSGLDTDYTPAGPSMANGYRT